MSIEKGHEMLKAYMAANRWTDVQASGVLGVCRGHLNRVKHGKRRPGVGLKNIIAIWTSGQVPESSWEV